jgi:hypothetical protein
MSRPGLALALVCALAVPAAANGRPPGTSTIHFETGHETNIAAGMTFGLIVSHDNGATWQWICEDAIGYGGIYDPTYVYAATGTLFATTFDGLRATRDGCTFNPLPSGKSFASTDAQGPDGAYYYGASNPTSGSNLGDSNIYKSIDDGMTFGSAVTPPGGLPNDWWQSITVAPSNPLRVYLFGYRFDATNQKTFLLYRSDDGAASFTPISTVGFTTSQNTEIEVVGIDKTNPDVVYAHATKQDGMYQHGVYRSDDAGAHWTPLFTISDMSFAFLLRGNGDLIVGTELEGVFISQDRGATWKQIRTAPHINCLAENSAGEIWACTANYSVPGGPPTDNAGIMKSTDAAHWTTVMKYQDITAPVTCGSDTIQYQTCQVETWCGLKMQLGITSTALDCPVTTPDQPPALEAPIMHGSPGKGCCDSSGGGGGAGLLGGVVLFAWARRPRRGKHPTRPSC